jgi:acetylornithine deacetylase
VTIRTEVTADVPPCEPQENSAAEALVKHLLGTNRSEAVSFGTEAALFQEKGMSVVICGPGNMDQAHQPNEFVAEEQLEQCEAFLGKLLDWAAPGD